jgi:hypothetical protein
MDELTDASGEAWGMYDGQCVACDLLGRVNDLGLCEECAGKLERDLGRERDWDYAVEYNAASAFGLADDDREKLRRQVVEQYGEARELIAPIKQARKKRPPRQSARRRM